METKFLKFSDDLTALEGKISGYASRFGIVDTGGDVVMPGAYASSLKQGRATGRKVKMLWQHDPAQPIGVWDDVEEDEIGLKVSGRLLTETRLGSEAAALIQAGAIDGLSIGYRTVKAKRGGKGARELHQLSLFEVSLVTFPMQEEAQIDQIKDIEAGNFAGLKKIVERAAREAGLSRDEANAAAAAAAERVKGLREAPDLTAKMAGFLREVRNLRT
ncbi:HK97 family phage prohead protease [Epibacterium ulvae]|uniref:HK97 family phage prohead protease n=1 Tax=Epibacterium ulvae TaxID=1156985 RepID=UPI0024936B93|nr:HK97 family phage prohead protease [Epibacterium ulvae]